MNKLAPELEAIAGSVDEVAVTGALSAVFAAGLPTTLADEEYEHLLVSEGFRSGATLKALRERHLVDMGLDRGTAALLWDLLRPPRAVAVHLILPSHQRGGRTLS